MKTPPTPDLQANLWQTFPVLQTARFTLREILPSDDEAMLRLWGNPLVNRYTDFPGLNEIEKIRGMIAMLRERFTTHNGIRWAISPKNTDTLIGTIGFNRWVTQYANYAVIGYDLDPSYWRQGIAFEVAKQVISYGFFTMRLHRVQADIMPANTASERLLLKLGFTHEGLRRDMAYFSNEFQTLSVYSLLEDEFHPA